MSVKALPLIAAEPLVGEEYWPFEPEVPAPPATLPLMEFAPFAPVLPFVADPPLPASPENWPEIAVVIAPVPGPFNLNELPLPIRLPPLMVRGA
jgi:hypothetical protein